MKKKIMALVVLLITAIFYAEALAIPELQLPFEGGLTLNVTRGYNTSPTHIGGDAYALDFVGDGCSSWNSSILTVADGTIIEAHTVNDNAYGKYVVINHGSGYQSKYAHLNSVEVNVNQDVAQGEEIGKMGNTGNVSGVACSEHPGTHLHFVLKYNGVAEMPEPMSGYTGFTAWDIYTSMNTYNNMTNIHVGEYFNGYVYENTSDYRPFSRPFPVTYYHNGGSDMLGYPMSSVYEYPSDLEWNPFGAAKVWVQDFNGGTIGSATLVMNMYVYNIRFNYLGVVYPIHGHIREYWYLNYEELGAPVTNEYYWPTGTTNYVVQWFEPYDNSYKGVAYQTATGNFYDAASIGIPQDNFNQHIEDNLGCPSGDCGVGGDGTEPTQSSNFTFNDSLTTDYVNTSTGDHNPEKTIFYNQDNNVYLWTILNDVYEPLSVDWYWYKPGDVLFANSNYITQDPGAGYYYGEYVMWSLINISSTTDYGQWHVDMFIDNALVSSNYFTITTTPPTADFTADSTVGVAPLTVQFTDTSTGHVTSWLWDFGDGIYDTSQNPAHTYNSGGTYDVKLTATGYGGSDDEIKQGFITVVDSCLVYVPDDYSTIQGAIDAVMDGCVVVVRDGHYLENLNFPDKDIIVRSENGPNVTVIDGNDAGSTVVVDSTNAVIALNGFTITNGYAVRGGGIYLYDSSLTITDCIISGNQAESYGGGIYATTISLTVTISNSIISDNETKHSGGGIYLQGRVAATITNSIISGNKTKYYGGGIFVTTSSPTITNSVISGNRAEYNGGGIYLLDLAPATITNSTVSGNWVGYDGGGIWAYNDISPILTNTIVWNNEAVIDNKQITVLYNGSITANYSNIEGGYNGVNNIDTDPLFVSPMQPADAPTADGNYHLTASSSCIDTGTNTGIPVDDIDGDIRPQGVYSDIGADEYVFIPPIADFTADMQNSYLFLPVHFTDTSNGAITDWLWDFGDGGFSTEQSPTHTYNTQGNYTVTLTITGPGGTDQEVKQSFITVDACFSPVRIAGIAPTYFSSIQTAYNTANNGDIIQVRNMNKGENLDFNRDISITLEGGYDCSFGAITGSTNLIGSLTTENGVTKIENFQLANYN